MRLGLRQKWPLLLLITALGAGIRFYRLADFPPGLSHDEAFHQVAALSVLSGYYPIFFPENMGMDPMLINTAIRFSLSAPDEVDLAVFDLAGQRVATLVKAPRQAGLHQVSWDGRAAAGRRLASGVYLCRLRTGVSRRRQARPMVLVR